MSIMLMSQVWAQAPFEKTTLLVLLALADQANDQGVCWPSVETIAQRARCHKRWVSEVLTELEEKGWLARTYRSGHSTKYRVLIPRDAESAGVQSSAGEGMQWGAGSDAVGCRETINEPSDEPSLSRRPSAAAYTAEFEEAWTAYPRKDDKRAAFKAYKAARKLVSAEVILAGIKRYRAENPKREKRYTKLFATWLNAGSWENYSSVVQFPQTFAAHPAGNGMRLGINYNEPEA